MSNLTSLFSLEGRTAIVTGASRGIGKQAAIALKGAGAEVAIVGRDEKALSDTAKEIGTTHVFQCDVRNASDMETTVEKLFREWGHIDILINNAGVIRRSPALELTADAWNEVIDSNLNAVFSWSQAVGKIMVEQGSGKIINLASLLSFGGGLTVASYAAAKGGVAQLTKALSNEWAKYNVQVNAIAPGYITTNATAALRANSARADQILARIPAGRWGETEDLSGAFIFLSSAASDYLTGHVLVVDGGFLGY